MSKVTRLDRIIDEIYKMDYIERPVSFPEFISNPKYLGKSFDGGKSFYDCWLDALTGAFANPYELNIVLTGAIGIGKTSVAAAGLAYVQYLAMSMKDIHAYYGKAKLNNPAIVFFSLTKGLSSTLAFQKFQSMLKNSAWFLERGVLNRNTKTTILEFPDQIDYIFGSIHAQGYGIVGADVIGGMLDEIAEKSIPVPSRIKILQAYTAAIGRLKSRFTYNNQSIGKLFLCSSAMGDDSALSTLIQEMEGSQDTSIISMPRWEALAQKTELSGEVFPVLVGDAYRPSRILNTEDTEDYTKALQTGLQIIEVPIEYYQNFQRDVVGSLQDIAGVSTKGMRASKWLPSEIFALNCMDREKVNPVQQPTLEIGLKSEDTRLINYLNLDLLENYSKPRFLSVDVAYAAGGDAMGISCCHVSGYESKTVEDEEQGEMIEKVVPIVQTDFIFRIKAPAEDEIPLKVFRQLVADLYNVGIHFAKITSDLKSLSNESLQILIKRGFPAEYMSVDKKPDAYLAWKDMVLEGRWKCFYHEYLLFEMKHLEFDRAKNKIDHPDKVSEQLVSEAGVKTIVLKGTKDIADSTCASVYSAILHASTAYDPDAVAVLANKLKQHVMKSSMGSAEDEMLGFTQGLLDAQQVTSLSKRGLKSVKDESTQRSSISQQFAGILAQQVKR